MTSWFHQSSQNSGWEAQAWRRTNKGQTKKGQKIYVFNIGLFQLSCYLVGSLYYFWWSVLCSSIEGCTKVSRRRVVLITLDDFLQFLINKGGVLNFYRLAYEVEGEVENADSRFRCWYPNDCWYPNYGWYPDDCWYPDDIQNYISLWSSQRASCRDFCEILIVLISISACCNKARYSLNQRKSSNLFKSP